MSELRDSDPDLGDDEDAHDDEQDYIGDQQPDRGTEDTVAGKDERTDQGQLQAGPKEGERGVSFYLLKRPEIVILEPIHALQKDYRREDPGYSNPVIEERGGYGFCQDEEGKRGEPGGHNGDARDRVVALLDLLPRFCSREEPDHRVGEAKHHHRRDEADGHGDLDIRPVFFDGEGLGEDREENEAAQADEEVGYADEAYAPGELVIFLQG